MLDARANDDVVHAGGDERRTEVDRLLGRTALQVDGCRRRLDRQALLEPRGACDVQRLLAELLDAAGHDQIGYRRIHAGALE